MAPAELLASEGTGNFHTRGFFVHHGPEGSQQTQESGSYYSVHFKMGNKDQKGMVTCPKSHGQELAASGSDFFFFFGLFSILLLLELGGDLQSRGCLSCHLEDT